MANDKTPAPIAIRYQETSRIQAKFGVRVETNFEQLSQLTGGVCHEITYPNGTKEGGKRFKSVSRKYGKILVEMGQWLVMDGETFTVYEHSDYIKTLQLV